jgi:general secretion pathway protein A
VHVDLTSALSGLDLLHLIGHSLGMPPAYSLGIARIRLHTLLHDESVDGRCWLLVVDGAHRAAATVWEELQVIVNRLGRQGGFGALVVVGETDLARLLAMHDLSGFASKLSDHVHLLPLDLDEARELLDYPRRGDDRGEDALERLHRDAGGNPRALLRLAERLPQPWRNRAVEIKSEALTQDRPLSAIAPILRDRAKADDRDDQLSSVAPAFVASGGAGRSQAPSLMPSRPPIRIEEGLVEVGWEGDLESELGPTSTAAARSETVVAGDSPSNEEPIEDRYAALQAWTEWSKSQERAIVQSGASQASIPTETLEPAQESDTSLREQPPEPRAQSPATAPPGVRAEPQQDFAPYSQLFTRLRQSKQP